MRPDLISEAKSFVKPSGKGIIVTSAIASLALLGVALQYVLQFQSNSKAAVSSQTISNSAQTAISALGRLKPEGEVIYLSTPAVLNGTGVNRIAKLFVEEGDKVKTGQVVATLDNYENLQAMYRWSLEDLKVAQANLAKVKAGAKTGEIAAQKAVIARLKAEMYGQVGAQNKTISRLKAEFKNAQNEYQRYNQLFKDGAVTASQLDSKQLVMTTAQEELNEAQVNLSRIEASFQQQIEAATATLSQIAEVRPTDVAMAEAEVKRAIASVAKAKADLDLSYVRSPIDGQVLKIHARAGEVAGNKGIVALGKTDQMNVIAEVYELDVNKLKVGQKATITSNAFAGKLSGTVTQIGLQVNYQEVISTDPAANVDSRVVEVKISLNPETSQKISNFTNLQVNVLINI